MVSAGLIFAAGGAGVFGWMDYILGGILSILVLVSLYFLLEELEQNESKKD